MEKELKKAAKACPCWYCEFTEAQKQSAREMAREKEQVLLRKLYPPANIRLGAHAEAVFAEHFNQKVNVDYYEFGDDYCDALLPGLELVDVKGTRFTDCQPLRVEEINTASVLQRSL